MQRSPSALHTNGIERGPEHREICSGSGTAHPLVDKPAVSAPYGTTRRADGGACLRASDRTCVSTGGKADLVTVHLRQTY